MEGLSKMNLGTSNPALVCRFWMTLKAEKRGLNKLLFHTLMSELGIWLGAPIIPLYILENISVSGDTLALVFYESRLRCFFAELQPVSSFHYVQNPQIFHFSHPCFPEPSQSCFYLRCLGRDTFRMPYRWVWTLGRT